MDAGAPPGHPGPGKITTRDRIPTAAPHELTATLAGMRTRGVDMVELSTVDNAGIARSEGIPLDHLDRAT